jgi:hypothetical protein
MSDAADETGSHEKLPRCGDHVCHEPSGECWVVAYADDFVLAPAGWPNSRAQTASCKVIRRCSDAEHRDAVREWEGLTGPDNRKAIVLRMYGKALASGVDVSG